jgi:uncharacterized protein (DUF3820 family)
VREDECVVLLFGKWRGCTVQEVDDSYLQWFVRECVDNDGFDTEEGDHLLHLVEEELKARRVSLTGEGGL